MEEGSLYRAKLGERRKKLIQERELDVEIHSIWHFDFSAQFSIYLVRVWH
jgi:hypothetical protein